jgi:hypothetical protein
LIRSVDASIGLSLVYCADGDTPHMILAVGCARGPDEVALDTDAGLLVVIETTADWDLGRVSGAMDLHDVELVRLR